MLGWINHVRYGDTWGLRRAILKDVRHVTESRAEMPIFAKTYDFLAWLVPLTNNFPRCPAPYRYPTPARRRR